MDALIITGMTDENRNTENMLEVKDAKQHEKELALAKG